MNIVSLVKGYLHNLKSVLLHPKQFFEGSPSFEYKDTLFFFLITHAVVLALGALLHLLLTTIVTGELILIAFIPYLHSGMLELSFITSLLSLLVLAGIFHLFCRLLKGKGSFKESLGVLAYTYPAFFIPLFLLAFIISISPFAIISAYVMPFVVSYAFVAAILFLVLALAHCPTFFTISCCILGYTLWPLCALQRPDEKTWLHSDQDLCCYVLYRG